MSAPSELDRCLERIYRDSGIREPDGRPLYGYRIAEENRSTLRDELRRALSVRLNLATSGTIAFCLYASREFCREHVSGGWKWNTVLAKLDLDVSPGAYSELHALVSRGFDALGRRVQRLNSYRYLATLVCEGGLPRQMLIANQSAFARFFRDGIAHRTEYPLAGSTRWWVQNHLEMLPPSVHEVVAELAPRLLDVILDLRRILQSSNADGDPICELDRLRTGWRHELPVELDDHIARELIQGLLKQPARPMEQISSLVSMKHVLELGPSPRLVRSIVVADQVRANELPVALEHWQTTFALSLINDDNVFTALCQFTRTGDRELFRREGRTPVPLTRADEAERSFHYLLHPGSAELATLRDFPGGAALPKELPWAFAESRGEWTFQHAGNASTAGRALIVAIPASLTPEGTDQGPRPVCVGELPFLARRLWRVEGRARLQDGDESYEFAASTVDAEAVSYFVTGESIPLGPGGDLVWRGQVGIGAKDVRGETVTRPIQVDWRPTNRPGAWRSTASSPEGDVILRARVGGSTVHRAQITVVPAAFRCTIRPLGASDGRIELTGLAVRGARTRTVYKTSRWGSLLEDEPQVASEPTRDESAVEVDRDGRRLIVSCRATSTVPTQLEVRAVLESGLEITLACAHPVIQSRFLGPGRVPMPPGCRITFDQLVGVTAQAYDSGAHAVYQVELEPTPGRTIIVGHLRARGPEGFHELPLHDLRDLASATFAKTDIDSFLTVWLRNRADRKLSVELRVGSYDARIMRDSTTADRKSFSIKRYNEGRLDRSVENLELRAAPMWDPDRDPVVLLRNPDSTQPQWLLDTAQLEPGTWMVTGWQGGVSRARPAIEQLNPAQAPTSAEFASVVNAQTERPARWRQLLRTLARDPEHPAWQPTLTMLEQSTKLPVRTFDLVKALPDVPDVVAMTFLKEPSLVVTLWKRLEELQFMWEIFPVGSWVRSVMCLLRWYEKLLGTSLASTVAVQAVRQLFGEGEVASRYTVRSAILFSLVRAMPDLQEPLKQAFQHTPPRPQGPFFESEQIRKMAAPAVWEAYLGVYGEFLKGWSRRLVSRRALVHQRDLERELNAIRLPAQLAAAVKTLQWRDDDGETEGTVNAPLYAAAIALADVAPPENLVRLLRITRIRQDESFAHAHMLALTLLMRDAPEIVEISHV